MALAQDKISCTLEPPEDLRRPQFGHASDVVGAAVCPETAWRTRKRSSDRYDQRAARHPFIIRMAAREYAQCPTSSCRGEMCHA